MALYFSAMIHPFLVVEEEGGSVQRYILLALIVVHRYGCSAPYGMVAELKKQLSTQRYLSGSSL